MDKTEVGKYYRLQDRYYFCPVLQMFVKFQDSVIIKLTHTHCGQAAYGNIVKSSKYGDEQTDAEIEICNNDIIDEYQFEEYKTPFFYIDFVYDGGKKSEVEVKD